MRHYFDEKGWPANFEDRNAAIRDLHRLKTDLFMEIIGRGELPLRSGIGRLMDEAFDAGIEVGVCSTSNERAVNLVVQTLLGEDKRQRMKFILAGDVVSRKKPDPEIYLLAREQLDLPAEACLVVEDSRNGLLAAKGAGMHCLVTKSTYTTREDFSEADRVVDALGDPPGPNITIADLIAEGL
jgi:HAD superfamily hydrolase (TIGR01509 family)